MWSLPDIKRLNNEAAAAFQENQDKTEKDILQGETCKYCEKPAEIYYEYYDIFSEYPKGYIFLCEEHDHYYGSPAEGYFYCESCERYHVENYTWENYYHVSDCEIFCLKCYFEQEIENPENWLKSYEDFENFEITSCKHLIAVDSEYWKDSLEFIGNCEYDSMSGRKISGYDFDEKLQRVFNEGNEVILILDAAYQFAVSIGAYIRK